VAGPPRLPRPPEAGRLTDAATLLDDVCEAVLADDAAHAIELARIGIAMGIPR
jgi:hypothetical protein